MSYSPPSGARIATAPADGSRFSVGTETMNEQQTTSYADLSFETNDVNPRTKVGKTIPLRIPSGRTEAANAKRFVMRFGDRVRWCDPWQRWLWWDGKRWKIDDSRHVEKLAKEMVDELWMEAAREARQANGGTIDEIWRFARASNQARAIHNLLALSRSDVPVRPEDLDRFPWLLNCHNGIVDLRDGTLRPHDRTKFLTQLSDVEYDAGAQCPRWLRFLTTIFGGDQKLIGYLKQLMGLSLSGYTSEHILPILHGTGANGKSVLVNIWLALLGSYGIKANAELLLANRDRHPTEIADLFRIRLVACVETDDGRRLAGIHGQGAYRR